MAVARPKHYCPICGDLIKEVHVNYGHTFVGDTFLKCEVHHCNTASEQYKNSILKIRKTAVIDYDAFNAELRKIADTDANLRRKVIALEKLIKKTKAFFGNVE